MGLFVLVGPKAFQVWSIPQHGPTSICSRVQSLTRTPFTDPFAEADEDSGQTTQTQEYIHIRIQRTFFSAYSAVA